MGYAIAGSAHPLQCERKTKRNIRERGELMQRTSKSILGLLALSGTLIACGSRHESTVTAAGETSPVAGIEKTATSTASGGVDDAASYVYYFEPREEPIADTQANGIALTDSGSGRRFIEPESTISAGTDAKITANGINAHSRGLDSGCGGGTNTPGLVCGASKGFIGMAPILDQGDLGTCVAHALATGTRIYAAQKASSKGDVLEPLDYSPDHLWKLAGLECKDSGSIVDVVVANLAKAPKALTSEACWHTAKTEAACKGERDTIDKLIPKINAVNVDGLARLGKWENLTIVNEDIKPIIDTLNNGFPVFIGIDALHSLMHLDSEITDGKELTMMHLFSGAPKARFNKHSIVKAAPQRKLLDTNYPIFEGGHALTVIGYSITGQLLIQNSWGKNWPEKAGGGGMFWLDPTVCGMTYDYVRLTRDKNGIETKPPEKGTRPFRCKFGYVSSYTFAKKDERSKIEGKPYGECALSKEPEMSFESLEMAVGDERVVEPKWLLGDGAGTTCTALASSSASVSVKLKAADDQKGCVVTLKALGATDAGAATVSLKAQTTIGSKSVNTYKDATLTSPLASFQVTVKAKKPKLALEYKALSDTSDPIPYHAVTGGNKGTVADTYPIVFDAPSVKSCELKDPLKGLSLKTVTVEKNGKKTFYCVLTGKLQNVYTASKVYRMTAVLTTNEKEPRTIEAPLNVLVTVAAVRVSAVELKGVVGVATTSAIANVPLTTDDVTSSAQVVACAPQAVPAGLQVSPAGCAFSGTPTAPGVSEISVRWTLSFQDELLEIDGMMLATIDPEPSRAVASIVIQGKENEALSQAIAGVTVITNGDATVVPPTNCEAVDAAALPQNATVTFAGNDCLVSWLAPVAGTYSIPMRWLVPVSHAALSGTLTIVIAPSPVDTPTAPSCPTSASFQAAVDITDRPLKDALLLPDCDERSQDACQIRIQTAEDPRAYACFPVDHCCSASIGGDLAGCYDPQARLGHYRYFRCPVNSRCGMKPTSPANDTMDWYQGACLFETSVPPPAAEIAPFKLPWWMTQPVHWSPTIFTECNLQWGGATLLGEMSGYGGNIDLHLTCGRGALFVTGPALLQGPQPRIDFRFMYEEGGM